MRKQEAIISNGFPQTQGPFVKALDDALKGFRVYRQAYYGGTFVGNHVHKALQVPRYKLHLSTQTNSNMIAFMM